MSYSLTDTRETFLAGALCLAGVVMVPILPMVGFPLCALALAGLVYRGKGLAAAFIAGATVTFAVLLRPSDAAVLVPGLIAVLYATNKARDIHALTLSGLLVVAFALSFAMGEFAVAWSMGLTYREYVAQVAALVEPVMAGLSAAGAVSGASLVDSVMRFAPSGYVVQAVVTTILTMIAITRAANRSGTEVNKLPRLDQADLSPHVLWLLIGALVAMAAGRYLGEPEGVATVIGLNLLLAARIALFIQGLAVVSSGLRAAGVGRVGRGFAYVAAFLLDVAVWIVSLIGLIDFWANLRKIDRGAGGQTTGSATVEQET